MDIQAIIQNKNVQIGGASVSCLLAGAASGYFYAKKKFGAEQYILVEEDVVEMTLPFDDEESPDSGPLVHSAPELEKLLEKYGSNENIDIEIEAEEPDVKNIFTRHDSWDYDLEASMRSSDEPYVIHRDEFFSDEMGFNQLTFTYYAGDDILTDEQDTPVHSYRNVVGPMRFGHGSLDPNVFYCRNEELGSEYEILYSEGFYSIEILGYGLESEYEEQDEKEVLLKFKDD